MTVLIQTQFSGCHRMVRRSQPKNDRLRESIAIYLKMQNATTEAEYQELLALHDQCTDADRKPRLKPRTLRQFRNGPLS